MFKNLLTFELVRTAAQALGFYIVFLFVGFLIGVLAGGLGALITNADVQHSASVGMRWGQVAGILYSLAIGITIVVKKKLGIGYYILALLGGVLAIFLGALLGLIIPSYMTTRKTSSAAS